MMCVTGWLRSFPTWDFPHLLSPLFRPSPSGPALRYTDPGLAGCVPRPAFTRAAPSPGKDPILHVRPASRSPPADSSQDGPACSPDGAPSPHAGQLPPPPALGLCADVALAPPSVLSVLMGESSGQTESDPRTGVCVLCTTSST